MARRRRKRRTAMAMAVVAAVAITIVAVAIAMVATIITKIKRRQWGVRVSVEKQQQRRPPVRG